MQIEIIGTSHIAKQSIQDIKNRIKNNPPDIIALELDSQRATALLTEQKRKVSLADILKIGVKGYLFAKLGQYFQQKLGKMVGISPGTEMLTALNLGKKHKLKIALIDQPIQITLKKFSKTLTWKERFNFFSDLIQGLLFKKSQIKKMGLENFDLSKVPEEQLIEKLIQQLKDRYPNVYKALLSDRNKYMVKKLTKLQKDHPDQKILVIVGAGHKKGMISLLHKIDIVN
ncbi:hypothetical protein HOC13_03610 [Candidatus Woesearchaeota archaeon]|jgi:pheromone shutdown-related protein TraB|nr:hypothetical protein [Candidatus Woesearchaeota archaeon]